MVVWREAREEQYNSSWVDSVRGGRWWTYCRSLPDEEWCHGEYGVKKGTALDEGKERGGECQERHCHMKNGASS